MTYKKGDKPWNKGLKMGKRPPKPVLTKSEKHLLALRMLYGHEDVAHRVRGRKSLFREHMFKEGEKLAALGMTMEEIAGFWNVHPRTLQRWAANKEDFRHTINKAKAEADLQVESSLFKKAKGYDYNEQHFELRSLPDIKGVKQEPEMRLVKQIKRHVSPDTGACVFWLLNRQNLRWKDKRQLEIPAGTKLPLEIILTDGNQSRVITAGAEDDHALPPPRESSPKP